MCHGALLHSAFCSALTAPLCWVCDQKTGASVPGTTERADMAKTMVFRHTDPETDHFEFHSVEGRVKVLVRYYDAFRTTAVTHKDLHGSKFRFVGLRDAPTCLLRKS